MKRFTRLCVWPFQQLMPAEMETPILQQKKTFVKPHEKKHVLVSQCTDLFTCEDHCAGLSQDLFQHKRLMLFVCITIRVGIDHIDIHTWSRPSCNIHTYIGRIELQ